MFTPPSYVKLRRKWLHPSALCPHETMGCEDEKEFSQHASCQLRAHSSRLRPLTIFLPPTASKREQEARSQQAWWGWGMSRGWSEQECHWLNQGQHQECHWLRVPTPWTRAHREEEEEGSSCTLAHLGAMLVVTGGAQAWPTAQRPISPARLDHRE